MGLSEKKNLSITCTGTLPPLPYEKIKESILGARYELSLSFVSPREAKLLNQTYRKKTYIPNTLSFPLSRSQGQIIICRSVARTQAKEHAMSYRTYLVYLLIHSMLHLKGFEHGVTMERLEARYLTHFTHPSK